MWETAEYAAVSRGGVCFRDCGVVVARQLPKLCHRNSLELPIECTRVGFPVREFSSQLKCVCGEEAKKQSLIRRR